MREMRKRIHKHITLIGGVGVGKSTLTKLLRKELKAKLVPADKLFKINPFFPLTVNDRARWSLTSDLWFLFERLKAEKKISKHLNRSHVVVDSGLQMSWVYARSRIGSGYYTVTEWELYSDFYDELVSLAMLPDVVVYIKAPIKMLFERIIKRGREFEMRLYSREYLKELIKSVDELVGRLRKQGVKIVTFDSESRDYIGNKADLKWIIGKILH